MSFLKPIAKSVRSRPFLAMSSTLVMIAGMLFGANIATADSVWVQSYERTSQTQACAAQPGETPWQASWGTDSSWSPSWEQWANGGKGGWVCTRSITWARTPVSSGSTARSYALGETGPGGGLVFLISGGMTYEMAPKNWSDPTNASAVDPSLTWCDGVTDVPGALGTAIGTGPANTAAMAASSACSSNAATAALAYSGTDASAGQWFLPSKDELNAMCNYSRNPAAPLTDTCSRSQDRTFAGSLYGFAGIYWSSSQYLTDSAWFQDSGDGFQFRDKNKWDLPIRPVRAF